MTKEPDDLGYVRRRIESLATSARNVYDALNTDQSPEHITQVRQWCAITSGELSRRAEQLERIEREMKRLYVGEGVIEAARRRVDIHNHCPCNVCTDLRDALTAYASYDRSAAQEREE